MVAWSVSQGSVMIASTLGSGTRIPCGRRLVEIGPGDQGAAAGRMRASDADRERVVALLQAAFAEGLLTREDFGKRVGGALTARTYADLATLTAGIPAPPQRVAGPAVSRRGPGRRAVTGACVLVTAAVMMADAALTGSGAGPTANLFYLLFIMAFMAAFISWLCAVSAHRGGAATGQPPQGPALRGRGVPARKEAAASPGQARQDDGWAGHGTAQATRGRHARRPQPRPPLGGHRVGLASH